MQLWQHRLPVLLPLPSLRDPPHLRSALQLQCFQSPKRPGGLPHQQYHLPGPLSSGCTRDLIPELPRQSKSPENRPALRTSRALDQACDTIQPLLFSRRPSHHPLLRPPLQRQSLPCPPLLCRLLHPVRLRLISQSPTSEASARLCRSTLERASLLASSSRRRRMAGRWQ